MSYHVPLRVAVGGNVDAGKSTFIGVLQTHVPDNGSGKARASVFNYPHELKTGRTSSVSQRSIQVNDRKVIMFDLAGHEKYLRTAIAGMSACAPHLALILVEANRGIQKMTKEHILAAFYLHLPIAIVITKMDMHQPYNLLRTQQQIRKCMEQIRRRVFEIKQPADIRTVVNNPSLVPVMTISSVNLDQPLFDLVPQYLDALNTNTASSSEHETVIFTIDKFFQAEGFPLIASGFMASGMVRPNAKLWIGPVNDTMVEVGVRTMHNDCKQSIDLLRANEVGCISLSSKNLTQRNVRPGMVLTSDPDVVLCTGFKGRISIMTSHHTTIKVGMTAMVHCGALRRAVKVTGIEGAVARGGDSTIISLKFFRGKHFVRPNDPFIFREGYLRGAGIVLELVH